MKLIFVYHFVIELVRNDESETALTVPSSFSKKSTLICKTAESVCVCERERERAAERFKR